MPERHVFTDDYDYFISTSVRGARAMQKRMYGECPVDAEDWYQVSDDAEFKIWLDDLGDVGDPDASETLVIGKWRDWIENYGPGFLCSTEY